MKTLEAYVESKNNWNKIFGTPAMTFPLSQADANDLMNSIGSELSPENLHCDGEASITHVRAKHKHLTTVQKQLESYCLANWLDTPQLMY